MRLRSPTPSVMNPDAPAMLVLRLGSLGVPVGDGLLRGLADFQVADERRAIRSIRTRWRRSAKHRSKKFPLHNVVIVPAPWRWLPAGSVGGPTVRSRKRPLRFTWCRRTARAFLWRAVLSAFWIKIPPVKFQPRVPRHDAEDALALLTIACMLAGLHDPSTEAAIATLGLASQREPGWWYRSLRSAARLAGRERDRLRYLVERAVRQVANGITPKQVGLKKPVLDRTVRKCTGGVMGKMIAPSARGSAVGTNKQEVVKPHPAVWFLHSLVLEAMVGLLTMAES